MLELLEPWCSTIYVDTFSEDYINREQLNTMFNLSERIYSIEFWNCQFDKNLDLNEPDCAKYYEKANFTESEIDDAMEQIDDILPRNPGELNILII